MSESTSCLNARAVSQEMSAAKDAFHQAYERFSISQDPVDLKKMKQAEGDLKEKIKTLKELTVPARMERLFDLRKQYDSQVKLLARTGFLIEDPEADEGTFYFSGATGLRTYVPSFKEVLHHMAKKNDLLEEKARFGFKKLLLVPFDMSLQELVPKFCAYLKNYNRENNGVLRLDEHCPVWVPNLANDEDTNGTLKYECPIPGHPSEFRTKSWIRSTQAQQQAWNKGWQVILLQDGENGRGIRPIPSASFLPEDFWVEGEVDLADIFPTRSPSKYRELLDGDQVSSTFDENFGECGMSFETWIFAFIRHLEETGKPLDDVMKGNRGYLIGAKYSERSSSGADSEDDDELTLREEVYTVGWEYHGSVNRKGFVNLVSRGIEHEDGAIAIRTEVRI